jgi:hypothetical protein
VLRALSADESPVFAAAGNERRRHRRQLTGAPSPPPAPPPPPGYGGGAGYGTGFGGWQPGARLPIPGNAEWLLWFVVEIIFTLIWIIADSVNTLIWVEVTTVLTAFYFLSRGIAKASRVLEQ